MSGATVRARTLRSRGDQGVIAIHDPEGKMAAESRPRDEALAVAEDFRDPGLIDTRKPLRVALAVLDDLTAAEQRAHEAMKDAIPAGSIVEWSDPEEAGRRIGTVFQHHGVRLCVMTPVDQGGSWFGDWIQVGWINAIWLAKDLAARKTERSRRLG